VTRHNPEHNGGVTDHPLYQRVERTVPRLARKMIETFVAEIPLYGLLPREQLEGEILSITEENLRLFFRTLRSGESLTSAELGDVRLSAARRAEERVPLDAVLTAYHVGARIGWEALVEGAEPEETDAVIAAGARVLSYAQQVTAEVAAAYLEEQQTIYGEERDARRALASALLAGEPADSLAARLGVTIAPAYVDISRRGSQPAAVVATIQLVEWVRTHCWFRLQPVLRSESQKGFVVLPRRWIVERTWAWLNQYRRLSKDYEVLPVSSEAMIYIAMIRLMLRRLAPA